MSTIIVTKFSIILLLLDFKLFKPWHIRVLNCARNFGEGCDAPSQQQYPHAACSRCGAKRVQMHQPGSSARALPTKHRASFQNKAGSS